MGQLRATLRAWFGSDSEPSDDAPTGFTTEEKAMKITASIAAALFLSSGLAHAEDATTVVGSSTLVEQVPYQPSELATVHGVRAVRMRISRAATRVCDKPETYMGPANGWYCVRPVQSDGYAQLDRAVARWRKGEQANAGSIAVRVR
jgi:UrcA family protein